MATPMVSGVAALVYSQHPTATPAEVRDAILQGADKLAVLAPRLVSGGRLNAYGALTAETFAPKASLAPVSDVTTTEVASINVTVPYHDDDLVDVSSLSNANISVRRAGFSNEAANVTLVSTSPTVNAANVDAVYRITPTSGKFGAADAGTYNVIVQANQIA